MPRSRYVARYFCSVDDPDATKTWFVFDHEAGVPLSDGGGIRTFSGDEVKAFLKGAGEPSDAGGNGQLDVRRN